MARGRPGRPRKYRQRSKAHAFNVQLLEIVVPVLYSSPTAVELNPRRSSNRSSGIRIGLNLESKPDWHRFWPSRQTRITRSHRQRTTRAYPKDLCPRDI